MLYLTIYTYFPTAKINSSYCTNWFFITDI